VTCNSSSNTINSYYASGAPNCGSSGCANFTLNPGTYTYKATTTGGWSWSGSISITSGNCSKMQLTK
ncbi:MAG TPA: hypothetical protein VIK29_11800, partial [Paludibacter sp.]